MGTTRIEYQISNDAADAHELDDNTGFANSVSTVKCDSNTASGSRYNGGFHFLNFPLPAAAKIELAWVRLIADTVDEPDVNVDIYGHAHDDAPHFQNSQDVTDRTTTTATVEWITGVLVFPESRWAFNTPDISSIIQEIVDRPGWSDPNSIVILLKGKSDSNHLAEFIAHDDGSGDDAATLYVIYTEPGTDSAPRGFSLGQ